MADDDLDAQFALFQRQIQTVTAKRRKLNDEPSTSSTAENASSVQPRVNAPPVDHVSPNGTSAVTVSVNQRPSQEATPARGIGPSTSSYQTKPVASALPQSGRWKWDGNSWKWQVTAASSPANNVAVGNAQDPKSKSRALLNPPVVHQIHPSTTTQPVAPQSLSKSSNASASAHPTPANEPRKRKGPLKRSAAGNTWEDHVLAQFPENDHRIFVGDLAPDASEAELERAFSRYPSYNMARIVRDKRTGLCRGYGFVSFAAGEDMVAALKEMNGKYVGSRPVKLKKSTWQKRNLTANRRKELKEFKTVLSKR